MKKQEVKLTNEELNIIKTGGYVKKTGFYMEIYGEWGFGSAPFSGEIIVEKLNNKPGEFCIGSY